MKKYGWVKGYHHKKVSADDVVPELEQLAQKSALTAENILDIARKKSSALHPLFEWDDTVAAEQYRKQQAQQLIRAIVVIEEGRPETRNYVLTRENRQSEYLPMNYVVEHEDLLISALKNLQDDLNGIERSVTELVSAAESRNKGSLAFSLQSHIRNAKEDVTAMIEKPA